MDKAASLSELIEKLDYPNNRERVFLIDSNGKYIYGQLIDYIKSLGGLSRSNDLVGKTILVSLTDDFELISTVLGLMSVGVKVLLVEPKTKKRKLANILSVATIDGWIVDFRSNEEWGLEPAEISVEIHPKRRKDKGVVGKLLKKKEISQERTFSSWVSTLDSLDTPPQIDPSTIGIIAFTSGTTANPKGVPLSHENILTHLHTLSKQYRLNDRAVISNILPIFHADGLFHGPFLAFYNGCTLSKPFGFKIQRIEELMLSIYKHKVSHLVVVPTILKLIDEFGGGLEDSFDTSEFKFVISAAAYLDKELWSRFMARFNVQIVNVYGLSESVTGSFFCGPDEYSFRVGTVGKPIDTEVRIVNENNQPLGPGQIGELVIKGTHVINNYLIPTGNPDTEGWFYTGDLGYIDTEGFYHIKGRKKSVIIRGGINTYPEELIEVLNQHEEVADSFVFGEADEIWGERIVVAIVPKANSIVDHSDILKYLSSQIEEVHMPDHVHFVSSLQKGISGKIIEEEVKNLIGTLDSANKEDNKSAELKSSLLKLAEESFNSNVRPEQYHLESGGIDGWNSLAHLHLVTRIEETFQVKLSTKDIMSMTSLSAAEFIVKSKMNKE